MKSLLNKNISQFLLYTTLILIGCSPVFYFVMKHYYTEDLDELIIYRSNDFKKHMLPEFGLDEVRTWNLYNEDIKVLYPNLETVVDEPVEEYLYNKSEGHNIYYRLYYTNIDIEGQPFLLMSRIPMIEAKDMVINLSFQYLIIFSVLLFSLTIVQRIISKKLWGTFYDSLRKIETFSLEQGTVPEFAETNITEFTRLNEMLSKLIKNNVIIYKQQKEFIENASHELQTPLAVFQSKLDILLQDSNLTESQSKTIQMLYNTSSRLSRLNKNLLLLAKIDNEQFKDLKVINFIETLDSQLGFLIELAENNGLHVSVHFNNALTIHANTTLLESLINNLIVNAIKHNKPEGSIYITVDGNTFTVSNTGTDPELVQEKIFRRFSRTTEEKKGNGLGLAIVSQICKLHRWNIAYSFIENRHTFTVCFDA